jgi:alkyldihydroxyacetonephosphate synthase
MVLGESTLEMLALLVGPAGPLPSAGLAEIRNRVPASRLPEHALVSTDTDLRILRARGQSFPDMLQKRSGQIDTFPDGVAQPETAGQVRELLSYAAEHAVDVIPYGGGTSVVGHINPVAGGRPVLTIDMGCMNQLVELDPLSQLATFGAGTPGPLVEEQLNRQGYTLGHFPQSWELSTVGGWIASRSSGQQSLRYGRIEQLFAGGQIETFAGSLAIPTIPASSAGPDIREMILGSEGRIGIISEAQLRVTPLPEQESFHVMFFPCWADGLTAARELVQQKTQLSMLRLSNQMETITLLHLGGDSDALEAMMSSLAAQGIGDDKVMMTFGVTGSCAQCRSALDIAGAVCARHGGVEGDAQLGQNWVDGRFRAPYLRDPMLDVGYGVDTMETAVDWNRVAESVERIEHDIRNALADEGEQVHVYTHLSHVYGQGSSIYTTYLYRCGDSYEEAGKRWALLKGAGARAIVACGGTISHQHGVGLDHRDYLPAEKGELGIRAIRSLCNLFDPEQQMNPGKLLPEEGQG